jgi:post-segregation antitoxin (ccd killing protein)
VKIQHRGGATKERALVAAYVDLDEREELFTLARLQDRSVSAIVRRALRAELDRSRVKP